MSLSLTASFPAQNNLVLPLAQSTTGLAVRVASTGTGVLGTLVASGFAASVNWTISLNPSWISATPSATDPSTLVLTFSNAQAQQNPYQFYVSCSDGVTTEFFPILLEVRPPFSVAASDGSTLLTLPSYDSTQADTVIQGIGLNGAVDSGVQFLIPASLPSGLSSVTSDGSKLILRVAAPNSGNPAGGITLFTTSPESTQVVVQAYKPGTMYDSPTLCASTTFTIESLSAKQGTLDIALAMQYVSGNSSIRLDASVSFLQGQSQTVTYEWDTLGTATGVIASGGGANDNFLVWTPATQGLISFTFKVKNSQGVVIGQKTINPQLTPGVYGVPVSPSPSWESTPAVKLIVDAALKQGAVGTAPVLTISTPAGELAVNETVTLNLSVVNPSLEATATLTQTTLTLTAGQPSATVALNIPTSGLNEKWVVSIAAANGVTPTRTGFAQVTYESTGLPSLAITSSTGVAISGSTGTAITPIVITAMNEAAQVVTPTAFALVGAPNGLFVGPTGNITGNALAPGAYTFSVAVDAVGYARSYSQPITLTVAAQASPLSIASVTPSVSTIPDGQQFNVAWGISGDAIELNLMQNFTVLGVLGATQAVTSEVGSSVISVFGTSFYGTAYSVPTIVVSSSVVSAGRLLNATTIATVDEAQNLTVNFTPPTVSGGYGAYLGFNIWVTQFPGGTPQLETLPTGIPTGLEVAGSTPSNRIFECEVPTGDLSLQMQALSTNQTAILNALPWANALEFPTALSVASVALSSTSVLLGQTLTITLDPAYVGADAWRVLYADGSSTDWLPLTFKSTAKIFTTAGTQPVVVQTLHDYSGITPGVKLIRQVTLTVYVMDQQYTTSKSSSSLTDTLGLGGNAGFEVTSAANSQVFLSPYVVIVRALVRHTLTNELKLLVATSRTNNASSLLGTMAADVFPLVGRPRVADLIDPTLFLTGTAIAAINPVKIATNTLPLVIVGKPMTDFPLQTVANSGLSPFIWYAIGLPAGLKLSFNGTLSGTPLALGNSTVTIACMDSSSPEFIDEVTLTLAVVTDLLITPANLPAATVGTPYSVTLGNTGGLAPFTWTQVSGTIPLGLSLNPTTGILSGTPVTYNSSTDFGVTYAPTFQVTDSIGAAASLAFSITLSPAALQFGQLDQPNIFAAASYRLRVPVFGGKSPYTLASFVDDGIVGTGLQLASPGSVVAIAGVEAPPLTITAANQTFYPAVYPANVALQLSASGGVGPYTFLIDTQANNTLSGAAVYGSLLVGNPSADGSYNVTVICLDSLGHAANQTITVSTKQQNGDAYTIQPVSVALNGSSNPNNWTVTPIAALPDAAHGVAYAPAGSSYYGLAVFNAGVVHLSQPQGISAMVFSLLSGSFPPGIVTSSGNSFGQSTDFSGIVLFNVSNGEFPLVNGSFSFEAAFSNIATSTATLETAVDRNSITVTQNGGGVTPVVIVPSTQPINLNLATLSGSPYSWYYPLSAEGGAGPYRFNLQTGTTLPGATITTLNGLPALTSSGTTVGSFHAVVSATDTNGVTSPAISIPVNVTQTVAQAIHILTGTIPSSIFANHPIPAFTYAVESDLQAVWSASGLPAGVTLSSGTGNTIYLTGTPTVAGAFTVVITATSVLYGTVASQTYALQVTAQTARFFNKPTRATVGVDYRSINNTAIVVVQYVGYQPTDTNLPLPVAINGQLGAVGVNNNGNPTTSISNLTSTGFTMSFDYTDGTVGTDTLTLGSGLDTMTFPVTYNSLTVISATTPTTISEYSQVATLAPPVQISGGLAPYTTVVSGFTDPRFTAGSGGGVQVNASQFTTGGTYPCGVTVAVTDSSGQSASATGTIQLTIRQESYITVNFGSATWNVNVSSGQPFHAAFQPNVSQSVVSLGHAPYQYYVDSVTLPVGLNGFVAVSPSKRVFAIQCNNTGTSESIYDLSALLTNAGTFVVPAVPFASAPAIGTYVILLTLRVVDSLGISSSHNCSLSLVLS